MKFREWSKIIESIIENWISAGFEGDFELLREFSLFF